MFTRRAEIIEEEDIAYAKSGENDMHAAARKLKLPPISKVSESLINWSVANGTETAATFTGSVST